MTRSPPSLADRRSGRPCDGPMPGILPVNLDDLLHARCVESARIEFKETWNTGPVGLQTLHTICAFANDFQNLNGGYIVLGVAARDGVAQLPPAGLAPGALDAIQKWIRGRCRTIDPEVQPVISPEVADDPPEAGIQESQRSPGSSGLE